MAWISSEGMQMNNKWVKINVKIKIDEEQKRTMKWLLNE